MPLPEINGLTLDVGVRDMAEARAFYDRLFGREPDYTPGDGDLEQYEVSPGAWLRITTTVKPGTTHRIRFGVPDLAAARDALIADGITVTEAEEVDEVARWCDFADPSGNPLGIVQDLSD